MSNTSIPKYFITLMSFAVGVMAANLYYTQPVLALIAHALGLRPDAAGLIMTLTQVGYMLGVLLIVPLGDLVENKKLILTMMTVTIVGELALGVSGTVVPYFIASILVGIGASTVQIIVPYTTDLFEPSSRGRVIGSLMSGLMLGIMLSRPLSSLFADLISFHAIFFFSATLMLLLMLGLVFVLPKREPKNNTLNYGQLIGSMKNLLVATPTLRRRATYQAFMFGAFCLFWTTAPLMLINQFHFTQKGVALFALAGLAGAIAAPYAGKMADKGWGKKATAIAMIVGMLSFVLNYFIHTGGIFSLVLLVIAANLLDAGVSAHLVLGQRAIFMIDPNNQSRLNGLYLAIIYVGGAVGSGLGAWAFLHGGWGLSTTLGLLFPLCAFLMFLSERFFGYTEAK